LALDEASCFTPDTHRIGEWVGPRTSLDTLEKEKNFLCLTEIELYFLNSPAHSSHYHSTMNTAASTQIQNKSKVHEEIQDPSTGSCWFSICCCVEHTHPLVKTFSLSHQLCIQTEIITINFGIYTSKNKYLYVQTVKA
jgi:hypothetical protein